MIKCDSMRRGVDVLCSDEPRQWSRARLWKLDRLLKCLQTSKKCREKAWLLRFWNSVDWELAALTSYSV